MKQTHRLPRRSLSVHHTEHRYMTRWLRPMVSMAFLGLSCSFASAAVAEPTLVSDQSTMGQTSLQTDQSISTSSAPISVQQSDDGIVALVNDRPILKSELASAIASSAARLQAAGRTVNPQQLQTDVLNQLILRKLQLEVVERAGIRPRSEVIDARLLQIARTQGLTALTQLQQIMDTRQLGSYAALRQRIIEEESLKAMAQSQLSKRVRITEQDIDAFLASPEAKLLQQTEYRTIHIRVPFSDDYSRITDAQKVDAMQIADAVYVQLQQSDDADAILEQVSTGVAANYPVPLQGGDVGYHEAGSLPVDIAEQITPLAIGEVTTPQITAQGIDVVKLIDKRGNETMIVPQWHVSHILIRTDDAVSDAMAEQEINALYEQLRQDSDFATLAATYSDDPGTAGRGGDLDWVSEGQMVPEFEAMMKRTSPGDYSVPFKSQFGWHILKVEDVRQQDISDVVRHNMAREALYQRLAPQAQEDWLQELRANAYVQILD